MVKEGFGEVVRNQPGTGTGAAVAVWLGGRWLVNLWGGAADASGVRAWGPDSIVQPYLVTKPFVAVCALRLVERGALDLDAAVQRYWPELTARATVRHLLSHQAGVVALDAPAPTDLFFDWDAMCGRLAAQPPLWEPVTAHGESALFYGHLVGEIVRRIDGRSIGGFLRDEVCAPLGLDFAIGLGSTDRARAVEITGLDELRVPAADEPELHRRAIANPPGARDGAVVNSARWRAAGIPAVNGHGTARAIAGFYAALLQGRALAPHCWRRRRACTHRESTRSSVTTTRSVSASASTRTASAWEASTAATVARAGTDTHDRVRHRLDGPSCGSRASFRSLSVPYCDGDLLTSAAPAPAVGAALRRPFLASQESRSCTRRI